MIQLLGLQRTSNISDAIKSWRNARMLVRQSKTNKMNDIERQTEFEAIKKEFSKMKPKFDHALKRIETGRERSDDQTKGGGERAKEAEKKRKRAAAGRSQRECALSNKK